MTFEKKLNESRKRDKVCAKGLSKLLDVEIRDKKMRVKTGFWFSWKNREDLIGIRKIEGNGRSLWEV